MMLGMAAQDQRVAQVRPLSLDDAPQQEWPGDYLIGIGFGLVGVVACAVLTLLPSRRFTRRPAPEESA